KLASQFPEPRFDYKFILIPGSDEHGTLHEPIALPGGAVFVPATLILAAGSEAEFAGIMAHAMAHVAARHGTRQTSRGQIAQMATIPMLFVGRSDAPAPASVTLPLGFIQFAQVFESEADQLAVAATAAAGYDPAGLETYVKRHPAGERRLQNL